MDSSTPNAEVMERYVESLEHNDWQAATAFWAEDVLLHFPGRNPFSGDFLGKEAFLEHYGRLSTELGGTIELAKVHGVLLGAEHVVALVRERAVRGERTMEFERVNVYSFGGGKITEIWAYDYDPYVTRTRWTSSGPEPAGHCRNRWQQAYSPRCVEGKFSEVPGPEHSALEASDKGQRSRWLVRRVASLTLRASLA